MFKISIRLYYWVEHENTGNQNEKKFQARVVTLKKPDNVNSKLNRITDQLIVNTENAQLHESGLIFIISLNSELGMAGLEFKLVVHT